MSLTYAIQLEDEVRRLARQPYPNGERRDEEAAILAEVERLSHLDSYLAVPQLRRLLNELEVA